MPISEPRVTCHVCNGTGDLPERVSHQMHEDARERLAVSIQLTTALEVMRKMTGAKSVEAVRELGKRFEHIVWAVQ